jgi:outer membrane lipoprotein-sorting protein
MHSSAMNPASTHSSPATFYVTGGTLRADAPSYVERSADRELLDGLLCSDFCYVLTSRQMGKSSLMVRTASRLRERGVHVAALDLTAIGQNLNPDQWYDGLLLRLGRQINLETELEEFWEANLRLGPCQRFFTALRDLILPHLADPATLAPNHLLTHNPSSIPHAPATGLLDPSNPRLVIFVDEIDTVRSLPFSTDEFFAAIRECYNRRSQDPELNRVTFCLLGVATPTDLIKDPRTTPFNIGRRIELNDFTEDEAFPLAAGLHLLSHASGSPDRAAPRRVLRRILYWTGGHPYLTQRLCRATAEAATDARWVVGSEEFVDQHCTELYLSSRARERDDNLIFVRERLLRAKTDVTALLELYQRVHAAKPVPDDPANPLISVLRLSGITRVADGLLDVRNRIYRQVFDRAWVAANLPGAELRRQRRAFRRGLLRGLAIASMALVIAVGAFTIHRRSEETRRVESLIASLGSVYQGLRTYQDRADVQLDMGMEGAGLTAQGECSLIFERPNRFQLYLHLRFGLMETELRLVSDGTNAWFHLPALNQYVALAAPASIADLVQAVGLEWLMAAPLTLYTAVAATEPDQSFTSDLISPIELLDREPWDGQLACRLGFEQRPGPNSVPMANPNLPHPPTGVIAAQVRVTPDDGLIREITLDLSQVLQRATIPQLSGGAPREVALRSFVVSSRHHQLRLNQTVPPDTFRFIPPPNAQEVAGIDAGSLFTAGRSADVEPLFDRTQLDGLIAPRPSRAGADQIDLTPHYNAPLTEPWHSALRDNDLSELPQGLQQFGDVWFDVRGVVQLAGTAEPYLRHLYPHAARGIEVRRSFEQLHLLHATGWSALDATHVASVILHYADGEQRAIPILYGYDVRNWWPQPSEPPLNSTGLRLAWQRPELPGAPRRLFVSTWNNPRPDVPVLTLDYLSALALPAPFLVAVTVTTPAP